MCTNSTEENKKRCIGRKNKAKKAVSIAMRVKVEELLSEVKNCPVWMFGLLKGVRIDGREIERGRCIRGRGGKLCFSRRLDGLHGKDS